MYACYKVCLAVLSVAESKMFFKMSHYEDELKMKELYKGNKWVNRVRSRNGQACFFDGQTDTLI